MTTYNKNGNNNQLQWTENIFKYAHNNQKYHKTKLLTLQKLNHKFKTTKQQLNCLVTDDCNTISYTRKPLLTISKISYILIDPQYIITMICNTPFQQKYNAYAKQIMLNQK